jgi:hypothetical protein
MYGPVPIGVIAKPAAASLPAERMCAGRMPPL